jgi:hypothetical protein
MQMTKQERNIVGFLKTEKGQKALFKMFERLLRKRDLKNYTDWLKPTKQKKFKV